jgi:acetoacetate decarboxylase
MPYPQPPWTLKGYAIQTLQLVDIDQARSTLPDALEIVSVFPGKTIGGIYLASYGQGSTLTYNELIVVSATVRKGLRIGGWISHIYVDNDDSIAGGRNIWGLPKEQADFQWQQTPSISVLVQQRDRVLCRASCNWQIPGWHQSLTVPMLSQMNPHLLAFNGQANFKFSLLNVDVLISSESPFSYLNLNHPNLSFYCDSLHFTANSPSFI